MVLTTESRVFLTLLIGTNVLALVNSQASVESGEAVDSLVINTIKAPSASVRLTNGETSNGKICQAGRLEVFYNGSWGTVCDHSYLFDKTLTRVACSSLGFREGRDIPARLLSNTPPPSTIWMDDVKCSGNETSIFDCKHAGWGKHNCNHSEDVGLHCFSPKSAVENAPGIDCLSNVRRSRYCFWTVLHAARDCAIHI